MAKLFGVREQEMNVVIKSSYLKAVYNTILVCHVSMLQSKLLPNLSALIYFCYHFFFFFRWLAPL